MQKQNNEYQLQNNLKTMAIIPIQNNPFTTNNNKKKVFYIFNDLLSDKRYLGMTEEYDEKGRNIEHIRYSADGIIAFKVLNEYSNDKIISIRSVLEKSNYCSEEYLYDNHGRLVKKISIRKQNEDEFQDSIDNEEDYDEQELVSPNESVSMEINEYEYSDGSNILMDTYIEYNNDNEESRTITRYKYNSKGKMIAKHLYLENDEEPFISYSLWNDENTINIINTYYYDTLHETESTFINEDGSKMHCYEIIRYCTPNRIIKRYDSSGQLIEHSEYDDYNHSGTRTFYEYDKISGFLKEIISVKKIVNDEKTTGHIEMELEYETLRKK